MQMRNIMLVFDMDGTIADLYNVQDWLSSLVNEDTRPYDIAEPMFDRSMIACLEFLRNRGVKIVINSWLSKSGSDHYNKRVRNSKIQWLEKNGFPYDEVHITKYGRTKADAVRKKDGIKILFDDNKKVRKGWSLGEAYPPEQIMEVLGNLISGLDN